MTLNIQSNMVAKAGLCVCVHVCVCVCADLFYPMPVGEAKHGMK